MFLKRMAYPEISQQQLYVGSIVTVYSRQLKLVDYGDTYTRKEFAKGKETTFALIKPDVYMQTGKIIDEIYKNGFVISRMKMSRFSSAAASRFLQIGSVNTSDNQKFLTSDVSTGIEIVAANALQSWKSLIGPDNTAQAKSQAPSSIRAQFGTDNVRNAVHGPDSLQQKKAESDLFFSREMPTTAMFSNCTCCVIKPHIVASG